MTHLHLCITSIQINLQISEITNQTPHVMENLNRRLVGHLYHKEVEHIKTNTEREYKVYIQFNYLKHGSKAKLASEESFKTVQARKIYRCRTYRK